LTSQYTPLICPFGGRPQFQNEIASKIAEKTKTILNQRLGIAAKPLVKDKIIARR